MRWWMPMVVLSLFVAGCADVPGPGRGDDLSPAAIFPLGDPRVPAGFASWSGPGGDNATAAARAAAELSFPFAVFHEPVMLAESTGRELSLAVDPNDPLRMIACAPTGTSVVGVGHSDVWLSLDGGRTWTALAVEQATDTRSVTREGGDCDVAIGFDGTLYLADTWLGDLSVSRSDDGQTWVGRSITVTVPIVDRPWLAVDPSGTLHLTYQDVQALMPSAIWYTRSTDRGDTFLPSMPVAQANQEGAFTWTGNLVTSDDGQAIHSIYTRRSVPVTNDLEGSGPEQVWVARSVDGGLTWASTLVSQREGPSSFLYPAIARDADGVLYATFSELRSGDQPTFWTRSHDGGATWQDPAPLVEGVRSGAPWVSAGPSGAAFQFLGTPDLDRPAQERRWWFYWGTLGAEDADATTAATTAEPVFTGPMPQFPEFNMVRVDSQGGVHIAGVAPWREDADSFAVWRPYAQSQVAGPLLVAA